MAGVVPITFRLPAELKGEAERAAAARRLSLNAFVEVALHNEVASACVECGRPARHVPRGVTPELVDFIRLRRGTDSIYVRVERRGEPVVYKGRLPRIDGRHLCLLAESPTHRDGEHRILLDELVDWEPATSGTGTDDWDRAHPGLPVDRWGLGQA